MATRVLFVCVENAGRSQMGEAFAEKYGMLGVSAGTMPASRLNPTVVQAMKEKGFDLSSKIPTMLTSEMIEAADIVVTMGCSVEQVCPKPLIAQMQKKLFDWHLNDPKHKPIETVRSIRDEIEQRVKELASKEGSPRMEGYGENLETLLNSKSVWHRFIEFSEPVKTVEQASRQVDVEKIAKSIVMVDSDSEPLIAIVPAKSRVSFAKIKNLLAVKDVRLASPEEVLKHSGYPAGGVPPFNNIKRALLDPQVLKNETAIVGGGDVDKLLEIKTKDIVAVLSPTIADIIRN